MKEREATILAHLLTITSHPLTKSTLLVLNPKQNIKQDQASTLIITTTHCLTAQHGMHKVTYGLGCI